MEDTPISISEFRRNTKVILDGAKHKPVVLTRGDEIFKLTWMGSVWQGIPREAVIAPEVEIGSLFKTPPSKKIEAAPEFAPIARTPREILKEIKSYEEMIANEEQYNQDPESREENVIAWRQDMQELWNEYYSLKEA